MKAGPLALLTTAQMYAADRAAMAGGVSSLDLMEAAGRAVAEAIRRRWSPRPVLVLAGPGNNGGDGYVAARLLAQAGWPVTIAVLTPPETLKGDAAAMAARWTGPVIGIDGIGWDEVGLVIDALFGAGLSKPVEGAARAALQAAEARGLPIVAIDVPSGVSGDSGAVLGYAPQAALTVSFFRAKPGHLLLPGRDLCGPVEIAPIGIPDMVLDEIKPSCWRNGPALWLDSLPVPRGETHKYHRGHALILGGPMTGAGRLAAQAARRIGAGLVSLAVPPGTAAIYAADHPGAIVLECPDRAALADILRDPRRNALLVGPGAGSGPEVGESVAAMLATGRFCVLDAEAISAFADDAEALAGLIQGPCVLTPHEGEFTRLFPDIEGDRLARAREAARRLGAVLVLKGSDTVIAAPDGKAAINDNAPADLATAGSGDVLAGLVLGLLAQRMPAFEAACAAVWLHGAAAGTASAGLIAEDIPDRLPGLLQRLRRNPVAGF
ncbi:NAD(P)H-hydrate dehydratase [Oceanibaculum indicum]|uniref:Bifunctional NAD(P)H-hydrate repair enzyme n=1 Tax=Oceanibaculum indicum P24 TaxID=1207063 RepID=K2J417_9PROT|nr:NAD(P)H-hydrate dehydratase [Oceanibaculum indicum]EKE77736.1 carbohydrate kinase [Oceanibaculum indicum P24]